MTARFRALYGSGPLHLLALLASLALAAAAIVRWFDSGSDAINIVVWFAGAILAHDLVLLPLYTLLDRVAFGRSAGARRGDPRAGVAFVRVPLLLSGLLLAVFFPLILRLGSTSYHDASGARPDVYLARWLATCGALFALSAGAWALRAARRRRLGAAGSGRV